MSEMIDVTMTTEEFVTENVTGYGDNVTFNDSMTTEVTAEYVIDEADDAIWILTSTFIIFTMQSGQCVINVQLIYVTST